MYLQSGNKSDPEQVGLLLNHLQKGTYYRYRAFITALMGAHQEHIVSKVLEEDPGELELHSITQVWVDWWLKMAKINKDITIVML